MGKIEEKEFEVPKKINILGIDYTVKIKKVADDFILSDHPCNGYTDFYGKNIIIADLTDQKEFKYASRYSNTRYERYKHTLRHEVTHAFIYECGLGNQSHLDPTSWSSNEPLVDWMAIQMPKLYDIWKKYNLLMEK